MAGSYANTPRPAATTAALNCPKCGGPIALRTPGLTASVVCPSCASVLDTTNPTLKILVEGSKKLKQVEPLIPLGARGMLQGKEWEVTGFMQRHAAEAQYKWREYLLFNPWHGFSWLVEENGHWNLVRTTMNMPRLNSSETEASWNGKTYKIFQRGQATVEFVLGEFYWRVKTGDRTQTSDFIAPPHILSHEHDGSEFSWSQGVYLSPEEVKQAFSLERELPKPQGIFLNQPGRFKSFSQLVSALLIAALLVFAAQIYVWVSAPNKLAFNADWSYRLPDSTTRFFESQPFELDGGDNNVELQTSAPGLSNAWLETELTLENVETGERFVTSQGLEYYSGTDSDGAWSEGSQSNDGLIIDVPSGKYKLLAELTAADPNMASEVLNLKVVRGVPIISNFLFAGCALLLLFVVLNWINAAFETQRWSESEYSPYATHSSDGDDSSSDDDWDSSDD